MHECAISFLGVTRVSLYLLNGIQSSSKGSTMHVHTQGCQHESSQLYTTGCSGATTQCPVRHGFRTTAKLCSVPQSARSLSTPSGPNWMARTGTLIFTGVALLLAAALLMLGARLLQSAVRVELVRPNGCIQIQDDRPYRTTLTVHVFYIYKLPTIYLP